MRDSIVGDDWIRQQMALNPIRPVMDDKGNPTPNFSSGPVRLGWVEVDTLPEPKAGQSAPKYSVQALFPPGTDFSVMHNEYYRAVAASFPDYYDQATNQYHGLQSPFRNQSEKLKYQGFTPGCTFVKFSSKFKPMVVDWRGNPVDANKVYPGVWAICFFNTYEYGKNPPQPKKGVSFGLQMIMLIGDDTKFGGGGGPNPQKLISGAGLNVQAPIVRPNMGAAPGAQPATPPQAPAVPQQHYVPQQGYVPAGAPMAVVYPAHGVPAQPYSPELDPDDDPSLYQ
jgi:hypothetical protein